MYTFSNQFTLLDFTRFGDILLNGTNVGLTDISGNFWIQIPYGTERVTLTFTDPFGTFYDKIKSVNFPRGAAGIFYGVVSVAVRDTPVQFDTTVERTINSSLVDITLPANAVYDANGELFTVIT